MDTITELAPYRNQRWYSRGDSFYVAARSRGDKVYMRCSDSRCSVRWAMKNGELGPISGEHDHDPTPWIPNRNAMFQALKMRCMSEDTRLATIYQEEAVKYPDAAPHLSYETVVPSMRKWRQQMRSTNGQIQCLVDHMVANPDLVKDLKAPLYIVRRTEKKWEQLTKILEEYGPVKSSKQWKQIWEGLVLKVKKEASIAQRKKKQGSSVKLPELTVSIIEALKNATIYDHQNEETWTSNDMWIKLETKENSSLENDQDPLFESVEFLDEKEEEITEETQQEEYVVLQQQEDYDNKDQEQEDHNEYEEVQIFDEDYQNHEGDVENDVKSKQDLHLPSSTRRKRKVSFTYSPGLIQSKIMKSNQHPADATVTIESKQVNDLGVIADTLNRFIALEKEKARMAHEREMSKIQQTNRIISVFEKFADVIEDIAPSIKKCLEKDENRYRRN